MHPKCTGLVLLNSAGTGCLCLIHLVASPTGMSRPMCEGWISEVKFVSTHTKGTTIELCSLMIGKVTITQSVVLRSSGHTVEMFMNVWWEGQVWLNSGSDNQRIICLNVSTQFNYTGGLIHGLIFPECTWVEWAPLGVQLLLPAWHMAIAVIVECSSSW